MTGNYEKAVEVTELTKCFGASRAVDGISFSVNRGEFFGFLGVNGAKLPSLPEQLLLLGMIAVNSFAYSGIMYFAGVLIKSSSAWSGFTTLIGTLVGFLGGIYIPIGGLPEGVQTIMKCLPVLHGCSMFRYILTGAAIEHTFADVPAEYIDEYR